MEDPKPAPQPAAAEEAPKGKSRPSARELRDWGAPALVVAASTAAVLGARTLLAPARPPAEPAPEPAAPEPDLSMPAAARVPRGLAARPASAVRPAARAAARPAAPAAAEGAGLRGRPAWTAASPEQAWSWPARLRPAGSGLGPRFEGRAPAAARGGRQITRWTPGAPAGRDLEFAVLDESGGEVRRATLDELEHEQAALATDPWGRPDPHTEKLTRGFGNGTIAGVRRQELQAMAAARGAVEAQGFLTATGMPVAKLKFADGHEEVSYYDPLVFDLIGRGVKTAPRKVLFDLYGYGRADKIQAMDDIEEGTGVLVFDATHSGRSGKDGREVLGDRTALYGGLPEGFADGFSALKGLVDRAAGERVLSPETVRSGVLDEASLRALEKAYGLKMRIGGLHGRTISLAEAGVKGIALSNQPARRVEDFDGRGNALLVQPGAVFLRADGSTGYYMNIWLNAKLGEIGLK